MKWKLKGIAREQEKIERRIWIGYGKIKIENDGFGMRKKRC